MMFRLSFPCLAAFLALTAPAARAEVHAVLVGVGDYLTLDADLKGPSNDVRLMAETLQLRGVAPGAMTVLTSDPTGLPEDAAIAAPIRADILAALAQVATAAKPGDTVVFYFSGHGAQAPDMSGDEGGGYDEILLPADATGWKGAIGAVENAILDDELQDWAQDLLARDIRVVGLIDACHSATGFRAVGGDGVARMIDAELLGIPDDVLSVEGEGEAEAAPPLSGEFVFLYSSQSDQRSFEYPLGDGTTWHGEFTLRLSQTLRDLPSASWSQILAATTEGMVQGSARQMPDGEGPLLDAPAFGTGTADLRYPIKDGQLAAGLLQGLANGAELAVYVDPAGGEPLATLTLKDVTARLSAFQGSLPEGALWAELVALPPPEPLALAAPVRADPGDGHDYSALIAALPAGQAGADLVPILTEGTVAFAGADGVLDPAGPESSPRIVLDPDVTPAEAVEDFLTIASHGLRLREVLSGATGRSLTGSDPVTVETFRRVAPGHCDTTGAMEPFDPNQGTDAGDEIWMKLTNSGGKAQDVSVLYFAADFQVQPIWPISGMSNRLAPGEDVCVGLKVDADSTAGLEEIWVLAVPVDPESPRVDLTRLAAPEMTRGFAGASDPMALWLEARMDQDSQSRGFTLKPAPLSMIRQTVRLTQ